jgi:hypothetical protein
MKRPLMAEKLSRLLSKLLDMGGTSTSRETSIVSQGSHQVQRWIIIEAKLYARLGSFTLPHL